MEQTPIDTDAIVESDLTLPAKDSRDEAIKDLDSLCRRIINLAHECQAAERAVMAAETAQDFKAYGEAAIRFGELRERIYNLKDLIEARARHYNQTCGFAIFVSHTQAGLPIRVHKMNRANLWN